jgi:pimeloyl-ACP methyl ester carboxylesterase
LKTLAGILVGALVSCFAHSAITVTRADVDALDANGNAVPNCKLPYYGYYDPTYKPAAGYYVMIAIHGGGWVGGDTWQWNASVKDPQISYFTSKGYMVVAPSYRLLDVDYANQWVSDADQKRDIENAFKLTAFLGAYNADVNHSRKIVMVGESAGGHLATHFALTRGSTYSTWLGGVVSIGGPLDFYGYWQQAAGLSTTYSTTNRTMKLGTVSITLPNEAAAAMLHPWVFGLGFLRSYYWNSGRRAGEFAQASSQEPVITSNSLGSYVTASSIPLYLVASSDDGVVAPEQSLKVCKAFGTPVITENASSFKRARCGAASRNTLMDVPIGLGHSPLTADPQTNPSVPALYARLNAWILARTL